MRFCVLTFGCRANQADSCDVEQQLRANGGAPSAAEAADVVIVNTCTVTAAADQAARTAIRRIARLNPGARIVVTGCYATRNPSEVALLPGVSALVPNSAKAAILEFERAGTSWSDGARSVNSPVRQAAGSPVAFPMSPGDRGRTAYPLKVQTGCDEQCAYCIVPSTRGASASRPALEVVGDVRRAAGAGYKELWVSGVHLGSYGRDLSPATSLVELLHALDAAAAGSDVTFRLSSLEPMDCGDELVECLAASRRFLPHVHLPLQHASDRMLEAMRRPYTRDRFDAAIDLLRRRLPDAALGTDLIAGFPGETPRDFDEQADHLRSSALTHVHVFPYSDRPGTAASRMAGKVTATEIRRRATALRAIADDLNRAFVGRQVGRERDALTLHDGTVALTDNYIKVAIPRGRPRNERVRVRIESVNPVRGKIVGGKQ